MFNFIVEGVFIVIFLFLFIVVVVFFFVKKIFIFFSFAIAFALNFYFVFLLLKKCFPFSICFFLGFCVLKENFFVFVRRKENVALATVKLKSVVQ